MVVAGVLYMRVGVGQLSGVKGLLNAITKTVPRRRSKDFMAKIIHHRTYGDGFYACQFGPSIWDFAFIAYRPLMASDHWNDGC